MHIDELIKLGDVIDDRYEVVRLLPRQGSYSAAYLVNNIRLERVGILKIELPTPSREVSDRVEYGMQKADHLFRSRNENVVSGLINHPSVRPAEDKIFIESVSTTLPGNVFTPAHEDIITVEEYLEERVSPVFPDDFDRPFSFEDPQYMSFITANFLTQYLLSVVLEPFMLKTQSVWSRPDAISGNQILDVERFPEIRSDARDWVVDTPLFAHNDIKPGNVIISRKLLDFEKIRSLTSSAEIYRGGHPIDMSLSVAYDLTDINRQVSGFSQDALRNVFGSARYADPRSFNPLPSIEFPLKNHDLWSLFALSFELLTGGNFHNEDFADCVRRFYDSPRELEEAFSFLLEQRRTQLSAVQSRGYNIFYTQLDKHFDKIYDTLPSNSREFLILKVPRANFEHGSIGGMPFYSPDMRRYVDWLDILERTFIYHPDFHNEYVSLQHAQEALTFNLVNDDSYLDLIYNKHITASVIAEDAERRLHAHR